MKTILITGSTDGIGKLTAGKLAKEGHKILLHGRNKEKLAQTISEIKALSNKDHISGFISDLSEPASILKMIEDLLDKETHLDVLINNAGVFKSSVATNKDGIDLRLSVNYNAPFLLTNGVLPLLKKSTAPRIINLSSAAQTPVSIETLIGNKPISQQEAYAQSKLALTMWSFYLAQNFNSLNVIAVNPGSLLNTKMAHEAYGQYWSSANKGAEILYQLAINDAYATSSGKYFDNDSGGFSRAHSDAYQPEKIDELISETNKILGL